MRARFLVGLAALGLAITSTFACGGTNTPPASGDNFNLITPGTLTVSTWGTSPPEIAVNGSTLGGLDGALINAFAADHNLKVQLFATDFTSSLLALTQHKADMGAYFYWSTTRAQQAFYTLPIFADSTVVIYKDTFNYTGPASLQGKRLGATVGSVYTPLVQKFFGTSHVTVYPGITQMSTALINGQVDALVEANTVATEPPLAGRSDIKLTPVNAGEFGIPAAQLTNPAYNIVPCGSTKLADALDAELLKLQQSGAWATALTANSAQAINVPSGRPAQGC